MAETLTDEERAVCHLMGSGGDGEVPPFVAMPVAKLLRIHDAQVQRIAEQERGDTWGSDEFAEGLTWREHVAQLEAKLAALPQVRDERKEFIRKTAIQLFSFYTDEDGEPPVTPGRAWMLAGMLWAAKPEDA
jgi:hypothetical protein